MAAREPWVQALEFCFDPASGQDLVSAWETGTTAALFQRWSADQPVIVDWGLPPAVLPIVQTMKASGFSLWWFDAPKDAARSEFLRREAARGKDGWPVSLFDHWWPIMAGNRSQTDPLFAPNLIQTLQADGSRLAEVEIARRMGIELPVGPSSEGR